MLARIEKRKGVLGAWTDKAGARIVVAFDRRVSPRDAVALVSSELAPRAASEIGGREASEAIRACRSGAPGWFRANETIALSEEEARVLAGRVARKAAEDAGLEPARRAAFERGVRDALLRAFEEQHQRASFDARTLTARIRTEMDKVAQGLDLAPEQEGRLREALEAEWSRRLRPRAGTEAERP